MLGLEAYDDWEMGEAAEGGGDPAFLAATRSPTSLQEVTALLFTLISDPEKKLTRQPERIIKKLRQRLVASVSLEQLKSIPVVEFRDKVSFFLGVNNVCFTVFAVANWPHKFPLVYCCQLALFLPLRFFLYYRKGWHYFTFDLCYYANLLLISHILFFPANAHLFHAAFGLCLGPVIWAVLQWRNSLVFHSLDKITSCFIHLGPCIVLYCLRWSSKLDAHLTFHNDLRDLPVHKMLTQLLIPALGHYFIWQITYYFVVNVRKRDKVASGQRVTSFTWLTNRFQSSSNNFLWRIINIGDEKYRLLMFMLLQLVYAVFTMLSTAPLCFLYRPLHAAVILFMFWACVSINTAISKTRSSIVFKMPSVTKKRKTQTPIQRPKISRSKSSPFFISLT